MSRGVSQAELAQTLNVSASYLSLIESGRRPASDALLAAVSKHLAVSVAHLRTGEAEPSSAYQTNDLDLKFADLAFHNGDIATAGHRFEALLESGKLEPLSRAAAFEARLGLARVREAQGDLVSAIELLERLLSESRMNAGPDGSTARVRLNVSLCRAYRESGDLGRAVDVGEAAMTALPAAASYDPEVLESEIQLVSTLAGCYFERGDLTRAHVLAQAALQRAEAPQGLPLARAAAYWNAALIAEGRGSQAEAHHFLDRARGIYAESENQRAIALLKLVHGWLLMQGPSPRLEEAEQSIRSALEQLPLVGTQVDIAYGEVELARCRMFDGDPDQALTLAEQALSRLQGGADLQGARARLTIGQARLLRGDRDDALALFRSAADDLRALGGARQAAAAWRELAEVLSALGLAEEALDAYRQASDAAGVTAPTFQPLPSDTARRRP